MATPARDRHLEIVVPAVAIVAVLPPTVALDARPRLVFVHPHLLPLAVLLHPQVLHRQYQQSARTEHVEALLVAHVKGQHLGTVVPVAAIVAVPLPTVALDVKQLLAPAPPLCLHRQSPYQQDQQSALTEHVEALLVAHVKGQHLGTVVPVVGIVGALQLIVVLDVSFYLVPVVPQRRHLPLALLSQSQPLQVLQSARTEHVEGSLGIPVKGHNLEIVARVVVIVGALQLIVVLDVSFYLVPVVPQRRHLPLALLSQSQPLQVLQSARTEHVEGSLGIPVKGHNLEIVARVVVIVGALQLIVVLDVRLCSAPVPLGRRLSLSVSLPCQARLDLQSALMELVVGPLGTRVKDRSLV